MLTLVHHTQKPIVIKRHNIYSTAALIWNNIVTFDVTATKCTTNIYIQCGQYAVPLVANETKLFGIWWSNFSLRITCHVKYSYLQFTTSTNPIGNLQQSTGHDIIPERNFALCSDMLCCLLWTTQLVHTIHLL
jgi:hypothetical protein